MNKFLRSILIGAMALTMVAGFSGCDILNGILGGDSSSASNGGDSSNTPSSSVQVFEFEYTDAYGLSGGSYSGGSLKIEADEGGHGASNGYYYINTWAGGLEFTFEIYSDVATTADMSIRLAAEMAMTLNSEIFEIEVNDEVIEYTPFAVTGVGSYGTPGAFADYALGEVSLIAGTNYITVEITTANTLNNGNAAGPVLDAIKLDTTASLSMYEVLDYMPQ